MSAAIFTVYENESRLQALSSRERKVELHWDICARQYQLWEGTVHCPHPCNWQLVWLPHETVPVTLHRFTMCSHNVQHNTRLSCFYWLQNYKYKIQIYKTKYTLQIHTMFNTAWCLFASPPSWINPYNTYCHSVAQQHDMYCMYQVPSFHLCRTYLWWYLSPAASELGDGSAQKTVSSSLIISVQGNPKSPWRACNVKMIIFFLSPPTPTLSPSAFNLIFKNALLLAHTQTL